MYEFDIFFLNFFLQFSRITIVPGTKKTAEPILNSNNANQDSNISRNVIATDVYCSYVFFSDYL